MKIEKEKILLRPLNFGQIKLSESISGLKQNKNLKLSALQMEMLELMAQSFSIEDIVQFYLAKKSLISFQELLNLIQFLLHEDLIQNPLFHAYFGEIQSSHQEPGLVDQILSVFQSENKSSQQIEQEIKQLPFMRSLEPELLDVFLKNMRIVDTPSGVTVCKEGDLQRSLFVLMNGQASVIRKGISGQKKRLAVLTSGSIFGEIGFFLGEPRTADVVTDQRSLIIRLKYLPEVFDPLIKKDSARNLQKRFWVIHSLLKSETFKTIPDDCFDALVFSGQVRQIPAGTYLCKEGEIGSSCFIIVQGTTVVSQKGESIRVLGQGDCVGEIALLASQGKRSATVQAQNDVVVLEIPFENFYRLLSQNLVLACEFEKLAFSRLQSDHSRKS